MKSLINALVLLLAGSVYAATPEDQLAQFQLFNQCAAMRLVVEDLPDEASDIGLTEETLQAALESRLRAARLYANRSDLVSAPSYLYLRINQAGRAFSISLEYNKSVCETNGLCGFAATWHTGSVGMASDSAYIRSIVTEFTDEFLAEYLKANEAACQ